MTSIKHRVYHQDVTHGKQVGLKEV